MPSNAAAWLESAKAHPFVVKEAPYVSPGPKEILVMNSAVAINPVDWKIQEYGMFIQKYPIVLGVDLAGTVAEVGKDVTDFKIGDRVLAHAQSLVTNKDEHGAFQLYTVVPDTLIGVLPKNVSFEEGCVLPLAVDTAAAGLFQKDALALQMPSTNPKPTGQTLLIWGGSSSVGACAIQLAKAAGYKVVTTASKRNHQFCTDLGADQVFDYNDADVEKEITKAMSGTKVAGAYDCVSEKPTIRSCGEILKNVGGVQTIASSLPGSEKYDTNVAGVTIKPVFAPSVQHNEVGPAVWKDFLPKALKDGTFKPKPDPFVVGKGLEWIQNGVDISKAGVSASKIVVSL